MYQHTQRGPRLLLLLGLAGLAALVGLVVPSLHVIASDPRLVLATGAFVVFGAARVFSTLTTRVDGGRLAWHFGPGLLKKSVPLGEIASVEPTTISWVDGFGIHLTRRGWLYNVAGRQAVLVAMRDGKRFLLGTDEPAALVQAIRAAGGLA